MSYGYKRNDEESRRFYLVYLYYASYIFINSANNRERTSIGNDVL
jgi:hypothetical protein